MNWRLTGICVAAAAWMVPRATGAQERPLPEFDKSQAVRMLRSGDMAAIFSVAHRAAADTTFGGPGATVELRTALVSALERAAAREAKRLRRGRFATEAEGEVRLELVDAVGRLGEPSTIPLLADVLADFSRDYLADFGELALDDVLRVVQDPDSPDEAIREGLTALRFMVEDGSLGAASLGQGALRDERAPGATPHFRGARSGSPTGLRVGRFRVRRASASPIVRRGSGGDCRPGHHHREKHRACAKPLRA